MSRDPDGIILQDNGQKRQQRRAAGGCCKHHLSGLPFCNGVGVRDSWKFRINSRHVHEIFRRKNRSIPNQTFSITPRYLPSLGQCNEIGLLLLWRGAAKSDILFPHLSESEPTATFALTESRKTRKMLACLFFVLVHRRETRCECDTSPLLPPRIPPGKGQKRRRNNNKTTGGVAAVKGSFSESSMLFALQFVGYLFICYVLSGKN